MKTARIAFLILLMICATSNISFAQTVEQGVGINPLGLGLEGLSYLEYERMFAPYASVAFRMDNFRYDYKEREPNYTYDEKGNGFGGGVGIRYYLTGYEKLEGLFGGTGVEFIVVKWQWDEDDYGSLYSGEGTTFAFALHFQAGYKISIGDKMYLEPSFYAGWISLEEEEIEGVGIFVMPAFTFGLKF